MKNISINFNNQAGLLSFDDSGATI
ncbi:MAG: hypothetical protein ACKPKO_40575 [Candidatus Fonsibacter sp.]